MSNNKTIGKLGEEAAADWLQKEGHNILCRNWRGGRVELDIVTSDEKGIHFVEVKSRRAPVSADPVVNVGYRKQQHLQAAALKWLHTQNGLPKQEVFFDIITVIFDKTDTTINYYPQAIIPIYV